MPRPRWPSPVRLGITFLVAVTLLVPAAYVLAPRVHRWQMIGKLTARAPADRAAGLSYVIRRAAREPAVLADTLAVLGQPGLSRGDFLSIVAALDRAGVWSREAVPAGSWLHWLKLRTQGKDRDEKAGGGVFVARILQRETDTANDPRVVKLLQTLAGADQPAVREATLTTVASLVNLAKPRTPYIRMIGGFLDDPSPGIARQAWLIVGVLGPAGGFRGNWANAPEPVAEAMLWAAGRTTPPPEVAPALRAALKNPKARSAAALAYALTRRPNPEDTPKIVRRLLAESVPLVRWRLTLGVDPALLPTAPIMRRLAENDWPTDPTSAGSTLALLHRLAPRLSREELTPDTIASWPDDAKFALLEGLPTGSKTFPPAPDDPAMPPLLRLAWWDHTAQPTPDALVPMLTDPDPTLRDLACFAAADRLTPDQNAGLIARLLHDYNDHAKMSAGILAGLTGEGLDVLRRRTGAEDVWSVRRVMRLGLWMQHHGPEDGIGLLHRADVPATTVLLAMLHHGDGEALTYLFDVDHDRPDDLVELLGQKRWWGVLRRYLPRGAPGFEVWADAGAQRLQVDALRAWVLVHRHALTRLMKRD